MLDEAIFLRNVLLAHHFPQVTGLTGVFIGSDALWEASHGTQHHASCVFIGFTASTSVFKNIMRLVLQSAHRS